MLYIIVNFFFLMVVFLLLYENLEPRRIVNVFPEVYFHKFGNLTLPVFVIRPFSRIFPFFIIKQ